MTTSLAPGQKTPLMHTQSGRQRVMVGISWDAPEEEVERPDAFHSEMAEGTASYDEKVEGAVGIIQEVYDLDLICLIYDENYELIDAVSPIPEETVDMSGAIYHTGDDMEGVSAGDDERVSVELGRLTQNIHALVFLTIIQSGHYFGHILNPEVALRDAQSNEVLWHAALTDAPDQNAVAMCALTRGGETGWTLHNLSAYRVDDQIEDWATEAASLISKSVAAT